MNITIKFNWFYCAIIQYKKTFSTIFSEWCGKTKLAAKLLITLKQEQEMKKFNIALNKVDFIGAITISLLVISHNLMAPIKSTLFKAILKFCTTKKKFNCKHKLQCCKLLQPTKNRKCIDIESRASNRLK